SVKPGSGIVTQLENGKITSRVERIEPNPTTNKVK
ncbi:MAG: hypothetical protein ACI95C_001820, partial [Pseudohongiellaceae bacterium]